MIEFFGSRLNREKEEFLFFSFFSFFISLDYYFFFFYLLFFFSFSPSSFLQRLREIFDDLVSAPTVSGIHQRIITIPICYSRGRSFFIFSFSSSSVSLCFFFLFFFLFYLYSFSLSFSFFLSLSLHRHTPTQESHTRDQPLTRVPFLFLTHSLSLALSLSLSVVPFSHFLSRSCSAPSGHTLSYPIDLSSSSLSFSPSLFHRHVHTGCTPCTRILIPGHTRTQATLVLSGHARL